MLFVQENHTVLEQRPADFRDDLGFGRGETSTP